MRCEWPVDEDCLPTLPEETSDDDGTAAAARITLDNAKDIAAHVMWALSGRQFGLCPETVRPCPMPLEPRFRRRALPTSYEVFSWRDEAWAFAGCGCGGTCVVSGPGMVHLPGPAVEVIEVQINGVVLDEDQYVLENNVLFRTGDASTWPAQNLSRPLGSQGTWSVEYLRGIAVPPGVPRLTAMLATEFYNACTGGRCRLPRTVSEVTRQGVTHRIVNPNDIYSVGKTGIPEVDLWLSAVNPYHLLSAPVVR